MCGFRERNQADILLVDVEEHSQGFNRALRPKHSKILQHCQVLSEPYHFLEYIHAPPVMMVSQVEAYMQRWPVLV